MKFISLPLPVRVILCLVALLLLKSLSTSIIKHCNLEFSYAPRSLFILFNAITFAIILGSHKPSIDEINGVFPIPYSCSLYEMGASVNNTEEYTDVEDLKDHTHGSGGHLEDETDDSSADEDEYDDDLQKRIEDFITKINNGWREEMLREKYSEQLWLG